MARGEQLNLGGAAAHRPLNDEEPLLMVAGAFAAAPHAVTSWAVNAGPGLICVYARVSRLPRGGVGERVRQLHAAGLVKMLPQRPTDSAPGLFDYRAERTALPYHQARPIPDEAGLSPDARLLLDLLARIADAGEQCPRDRDLAAMLGLKGSAQIGRLIAQLRARNLITSQLEGPAHAMVRVVTIAETGASTGSPSAKRKGRG